ncbi:MAG TPA: asparagine synthase-related protein [Bryobacteraceae bacterium]
MSGIVGLINRGGAPIDRDLLIRMTDFMAFRGPDAQQIWIDGDVGFGHALLRTTGESETEKQPCTLDGEVWITADARIDAREDLIAGLRAAGCVPQRNATDPELILHAYQAWKERCVEHLLGDFAFAIWDKFNRRLFCARDQLGIKPFYYSQAGGAFLFSNTLKCLRLNPAVSDSLNDAAIVDFLLSGTNLNPGTTTFTDIQRLPPAHYLTGSPGREFYTVQYWTLPADDPVLYRRPDEYIDRFRHLLDLAVRDRLRTSHVGIFMSGGLDSSSLAATARNLLAAQSPSYDLRAYTTVYDRILPDEERHYAGLVADALHIPIHFLSADDYKLYDRWEQREPRTPGLMHHPLGWALNLDLLTKVSTHCRVTLFGEGPDNAMYYEWQTYVARLLKTFHWGALLRNLAWHARFHREIPVLRGLRRRIMGPRNKRRAAAPPPGWIRSNMLSLATREVTNSIRERPLRPVAHSWVTGPLWDSLFESCDPGISSFPVEVRHPYMDLRVIRYLLAVPPIPWCRDKYLLRRSFQGILPDAVLQRPKTPLTGDPLLLSRRDNGIPQWVPEAGLSHYVDPEAVCAALSSNLPPLSQNLRPVTLNYFLAFNRSTVRKYPEGEC